ncbi:thymocyte nuclear protein 1 [Eurytemora carolleeae]|uniref:thymocyte nuclear protein 1 n=1 Tax=Eurytemora carolleeae TaxID=1294199 RepID=UPI000C7873B2|nr:thymocyte nuclear protein 1 [Eurytemora carolleeae]|eukprot:XP_023331594.1 thymocyte nuclear protein 1-like [Eurytemora affinis]
MAPKGRKRKVSELVETPVDPVLNVKPSPEYRHWLMKSEPDSRKENGVEMKFSFDDLKMSEGSRACWDGVRNYQARNFMRNMKIGDKAFFYHSNTKPPGIIGIVDIVKEAYTDHTQFDKKDPHYDPKSSKDAPRWEMVDVQYVRTTQRYIPLDELKRIHLEHKAKGGPLSNLALFTRARLSVQPITQEEWDFILSLEKTEP